MTEEERNEIKLEKHSQFENKYKPLDLQMPMVVLRIHS